eukprot:2428788-Prymnesium_polylepis.3
MLMRCSHAVPTQACLVVARPVASRWTANRDARRAPGLRSTGRSWRTASHQRSSSNSRVQCGSCPRSQLLCCHRAVSVTTPAHNPRSGAPQTRRRASMWSVPPIARK